MLINKDASRIYSTTLSSKQLLYACMCLCVIIYTSIHSTTLLEVEELGKYRVVFLRGGSRKMKIDVRAVRFSLKFESDFALTFLIDAEVPELKLADNFSQLHHKDRTIAKTSRGVKTHSMNQDRSQFG